MRQRVAGGASLGPAANQSGEHSIVTIPLIFLTCDSL